MTIPVGHDHPDTSHEMAARRAPKEGTIRAQIMESIGRLKDAGATDDDLEVILGRSHQSVSAARNSLVRDGWLRDSGERRKNRWGNRAIVWVHEDPIR